MKFGRARRTLAVLILGVIAAMAAPAHGASAADDSAKINDPSAPIILGAPTNNPVADFGNTLAGAGDKINNDGNTLAEAQKDDVFGKAGWTALGWVANVAGQTTKVVGKAVAGCANEVADNGISWQFFLACGPPSIIGQTAAALFTSVTYAIVKQINSMIKTVFSWQVDWIFGSVLGGNDKANAAGQHGFAAPDLHATFFSDQMNITRKIAMYLVVPIFLLALMQAIMKGSLFFLLRATLIMLPVSIVGSAVVVELSYQLLGVADDISTSIASTSMDNSHEWLKTMLDTYEGNNFTIFEALWFLVGILAIFVIIAELIIRELGVYMAVFFMPLGFAALVWPATAKFARRLVELLIGLIFSKVFIVAALALGMAALGHAQGVAEANGTQIGVSTLSTGLQTLTGVDAGNGANIQPLESLQGLTAAVAIFFMAAFSGVKIMEIAPGASAAVEGRLMSPGNIMNKGHVTNLVVGSAMKGALKRRDNISPSAAKPQRSNPTPPTKATPAPLGGGSAPTPSSPAPSGPATGGGGSRPVSTDSGGKDGGHYGPETKPGAGSATTPQSNKNKIRNNRNGSRNGNPTQSPINRRRRP